MPFREQPANEIQIGVILVRHLSAADTARQIITIQQPRHARRREGHGWRLRQTYESKALIKRCPKRVQRAQRIPRIPHHAQDLINQGTRMPATPGIRTGRQAGNPSHLVHNATDVLAHRHSRYVGHRNPVLLGNQRDVIGVVLLGLVKILQ
jgi:hypothetical protein